MKEKRLKRMEYTLKKVLSEKFYDIMQGFQEEYGVISISKIRISDDFSYLDIYVSAYKYNALLCKKLSKYDYIIKKIIATHLQMRKIPIVRFRYDESILREYRIICAIE